MPHYRCDRERATVAAVAETEESNLETFAGRLAHVLKRDGVSNRELGRRLAGPDASDKQADNQRTGVLRWLREGVEPSPQSARAVEIALGLENGYLVSVVKPKPRGRPARLSREEELRGLRADIEALRAEVEGLAAEVKRLQQDRAPQPGGKPHAPSTLGHPGGGV